MRTVSLCTGYGGLDLAVRAVLGGGVARVADSDPDASRVLARRFPGVPNLGDIREADWGAAGGADLLTAGFPCQDVSCAGARKGLRAGTRTGVWAHVAEAIAALRPRLVLLENVRGLLSAGADSGMEPCPWCLGDAGPEHAVRALGVVLGDLADLGLDAEWQVVSAADAGAPHRRERVFILAWPAADPERDGRQGRQPADRAHEGRPAENTGGCRPARSGGAPADTQGVGWREGRPEPAGLVRRPDAAVRGDASAADADGRRRRQGEREVPARERDADRGAPAGPGDARLGQFPGGPSAEEAGPVAGDQLAGDRGARTDPVGRPAAADADGDGLARGAERDSAAQQPGFGSARRVDPLRRVLDWGPYRPAVERWERVVGRPAPPPTEPGRTGDRLSPRFVEWMQGLPDGWVTGVPGLSRPAQLRILGNGVVPQQGALALRLLLARAGLRACERAA